MNLHQEMEQNNREITACIETIRSNAYCDNTAAPMARLTVQAFKLSDRNQDIEDIILNQGM